MEKKNNMLEVIEEIAKANQEAKKACNQIEFYDIEQKIKKLTDELVNLYSDNLDTYKERRKIDLDKVCDAYCNVVCQTEQKSGKRCYWRVQNERCQELELFVKAMEGER